MSSNEFAAFMPPARARVAMFHRSLRGTDAQVAQLIADALELLDPDTADAATDAGNLAAYFSYMASEFGGDTDYPDNNEDDNDVD